MKESQNVRGEDSAADIIRAVLRGGMKAARVFDDATGGCRLSDASEHFLTAGIFESLSKLKGFTHLEVSVDDCLREARAIRRGRHAKLTRVNGRYDLVHYRANESPRVAIEVKNGIRDINRAALTADFTRLSESLKASSGSTYQFCAFVFFCTADYSTNKSSKAARNRVARERVNEIIGGVGLVASEFTAHQKRPLLRRVYSSKIHCSPDADEGAWAVAIVVFADSAARATFPSSLDV